MKTTGSVSQEVTTVRFDRLSEVPWPGIHDPRLLNNEEIESFDFPVNTLK